MVKLPQKLPIDQMQNQWAAAINPVLSSPIVSGLQLNNVALANGTTVINHKLGRKLQGWLIVGINANATIHDNQATNQMSDLTLSLTSNAAVTVNLWVY